MLLRTVPMYISLRLASTEECSEYTYHSRQQTVSECFCYLKCESTCTPRTRTRTRSGNLTLYNSFILLQQVQSGPRERPV